MLLYCPKEIILAHLKPADSGGCVWDWDIGKKCVPLSSIELFTYAAEYIETNNRKRKHSL